MPRRKNQQVRLADGPGKTGDDARPDSPVGRFGYRIDAFRLAGSGLRDGRNPRADRARNSCGPGKASSGVSVPQVPIAITFSLSSASSGASALLCTVV